MHKASARSVPVSREGPQWRVRAALVPVLAILGLAVALALLLRPVRSGWPLLVGAAASLMSGAMVLRRRDTLEADVLVVRRLTTRRVDLTTASAADLQLSRADPAVVLLRVRTETGGTVAVPVWRTRPPRGVDPFAAGALAERLARGPAGTDRLVALLRGQTDAVRAGQRPTPLDRWAEAANARRGSARPVGATPGVRARPPARRRG